MGVNGVARGETAGELRQGFVCERFMDDRVRKYTVSIHYDRRLYRQDITGSIVHVRMLARQGIIRDDECQKIVSGLETVRTEIENGSFPWDEGLEDIHMNVESRLGQLIGLETAGRMHTGRSRNDQIALDLRMFVKDAVGDTLAGLARLQGALLVLAESHNDTLMPGYTHLQRAQPVLLAHHLLAYFQMLERDKSRFADCRNRTDVLPLGSGALAGVPYPTDREFLARELGFSSISENSMDAVSDRDFVVEFQSAASICMMHLSRFAEELALWTSQEFGYIRLSPEYVTGSSIMPQKRNPDFAELARGKTGRVYGHLVGVLTTMKGLPMTYNRDLQEDKEGLFDTVDTLLATLDVFTGMISTLEVDTENMVRASSGGYMLATDLADYLVTEQGMPFREAHGVVSRLCDYATDHGKGLDELTMEELNAFSPEFREDVKNITARSSAAARNVYGGTAPAQVRDALDRARSALAHDPHSNQSPGGEN